jgi:hypothetical protein
MIVDLCVSDKASARIFVLPAVPFNGLIGLFLGFLHRAFVQFDLRLSNGF